MKVKIASSVFRDDSNYHHFIALLQLCYINRRYDFYVDITEIEDTILYNLIAKPDKDLISEYFEKHINESGKIDLVIDNDSRNNESISLIDSLRMLAQPLFIVLENGTNDRNFIDCLVINFKKRGKKITKHIENNWISFEHGGGKSGLRDVINGKLRLFEGLPRSPESYLRAFVLLDSDSEFRGQLKKDTIDQCNFLDELRIPYHVFVKREMENYLPLQAYDAIEGDADFKAALARLRPDQLDYIDIENGFDRSKNFDSFHQSIKDLFQSVNIRDRDLFRNSSLGVDKFKSEFPKMFLNESVTQDTLLARVSHQEQSSELTDILDKINRIL